MINDNKPGLTADVTEQESLLQLHVDEHVLPLQLHVDEHEYLLELPVDEHELLLQLRVDDMPKDDGNPTVLLERTVSELGLRLVGQKVQLSICLP